MNSGILLCDRSHWGLIQLTGEDGLQFLHNQSTNDMKRLQPGQGCDTVFVNSTARTIDLTSVYVTEDAVFLLISPGQTESMLQWLDRYLFPMDRVELKDISEENAIFSLMGEASEELLPKLGAEALQGQTEGNHAPFTLGEVTGRITVGSGLATPGYTLIVPKTGASPVWEALEQLGAVSMSQDAWETLRIQQGRPLPNHELTEDYNPLEAGLWRAISFDKGCYIGQETIARLNTYKGVKQRLWGIKLEQPVTPGTEIYSEGKKIGVVTSCREGDDGTFALGYIKTKAGGEGLNVQIGESPGNIVAVPFLSHDYYDPQGAAS
ncbi:folate-binding protein [Spirulina sp. CS-785/01]|uniref:CAF17-like 4Fe-4S cluster assembly/insertion protein YgfZ n=1 Tax=Spirulina sp. CS-785/01 TaxID=3021716 RepID=UPI00232BEAE2|nr:folate-binding protein [Spirulina sp. CS-785/01]MDB9312233.1 folate-binding protein [Spirulina sp. CS-785/01]